MLASVAAPSRIQRHQVHRGVLETSNQTESTLYISMVSSGSVSLKRHEADRVRAVRIVFTAQPQMRVLRVPSLYANALLCRLDEAATRYGPTPRDTPGPKRAQRQASRLIAVRFPASTASQASIQAERERTAQNELPRPGRRNEKRNDNSPA